MLKERDIKWKRKRTKKVEGKEKEKNPGKGPLTRIRSEKQVTVHPSNGGITYFFRFP